MLFFVTAPQQPLISPLDHIKKLRMLFSHVNLGEALSCIDIWEINYTIYMQSSRWNEKRGNITYLSN